MEHEAHTRVDKPLPTVYNQWTQFESFPAFMEGVKSVQQLDDSTTAWSVEIAGVERRFTADIVEQQPDRLIHWRTRDEPVHEGQVSFQPDGNSTHVKLWMRFEPEGLAEQAADKLGFVKARVEGDLGRFKTFIEQRPAATGAWRGSLPNDPATSRSGGL